MTQLLHIAASPRGESSESLQIARTFLDAYLAAHPGHEIDTWNLWDGSLPEFGPAAAAAKMAIFAGRTAEGAQAAAWHDASRPSRGLAQPSICCSPCRCGTPGSHTSSSS